MNHSTTQHIEQFITLTKREVEIIELLANDQNNPQITEQLFQYALAIDLV